MDILKFIFICLEVVLLFNLIIVVHELGHFLAARWRGLVVERFGIWFGKPIWEKSINGVKYSLGWIPAGGFVALPQLAPMESLEGKSDHERENLPKASPLDKIIVAAAGPVFSLALAFVFATAVWMIGRPVSEAEMTTTIGWVAPDGPAAKAGLQPGDKILSVNANKVTRFSGMGDVRESITWNIASSTTPFLPITFERNGKEERVVVEAIAPEREGLGRKNLRQIAIAPAQTPMVARVFPNSPAADAGIKPRDQIVAADGQRLLSLFALAEILATHGTQPITLEIRRDGKTFPVTLTPEIPENGQKPMVGILWDDRGETTLAHPTPWQQVSAGFTTIYETLSAVLTPSSGIKAEHLSGPVGIMRLYYLLFETPDGWILALWFSVILNVNLALINLLPIPVLDGGHILLALIEGTFRRPIAQRYLEMIQTACAALIVCFMLYVTFYDVLDLPWKNAARQEQVPDLKFSPGEQK